MKKLIGYVVAVLTMIFLVGCGGSSDTTTSATKTLQDWGIPPEAIISLESDNEAYERLETQKQVSDNFTSNLIQVAGNENPYQDAVDMLKTNPNVVAVEEKDNNLYIYDKTGGRFNIPLFDRPVNENILESSQKYGITTKNSKDYYPNGAKKALIFSGYQSVFNDIELCSIKNSLTSAGYVVDLVIDNNMCGGSATSFGSEKLTYLKNIFTYDVVYIGAHGGIDSIYTGIEVDSSNSDSISFSKLSGVETGMTGDDDNNVFVLKSDFFKNNNGVFNNTIFHVDACQVGKYKSNFSQKITDKGASLFIAYDDYITALEIREFSEPFYGRLTKAGTTINSAIYSQPALPTEWTHPNTVIRTWTEIKEFWNQGSLTIIDNPKPDLVLNYKDNNINGNNLVLVPNVEEETVIDDFASLIVGKTFYIPGIEEDCSVPLTKIEINADGTRVSFEKVVGEYQSGEQDISIDGNTIIINNFEYPEHYLGKTADYLRIQEHHSDGTTFEARWYESRDKAEAYRQSLESEIGDCTNSDPSEIELNYQNNLVSGRIINYGEYSGANYIRITPPEGQVDGLWSGIMCTINHNNDYDTFGNNCILQDGGDINDFINGKNYEISIYTDATDDWRGNVDGFIAGATYTVPDLKNMDVGFSVLGIKSTVSYNPNWSGKIQFLDDDNNEIPTPVNSAIRITPDVDQVDWHGIIMDVNSDGTWATSLYNIDSTHYTSSHTFDFIVFDDSTTPGNIYHKMPSISTISDFNAQTVIIGGSPVAISVSPTSATVNQDTTFTLTGLRLTYSPIAMSLEDGECGDIHYVTDISAQITCSPKESGSKQFYVGKTAGGEPIDGAESLFVDVQ